MARWQLLDAGIGRRAIGHRLECGRLHAIHPGVYAVGHPHLGEEGKLVAVALAGGRGALIGHGSAGHRWGLLRAWRRPIDVTVPRWRRPSAGIRFHQALVPEDERAVRDGVPLTSVPRTLLDLSAVLDPHRLERAIEQAEVLGLRDQLSLPELIARYPGRRGIARLRMVLAGARIGQNATRSELEDRFLGFVAEHGLPRPAVNAPLHLGGRSYEVDCLWRDAGLVVELDGYSTHGTRAAFERDRARIRALQAAGFTVFPVTWRDLRVRRAELARQLRGACARRR